MEGGRRAWEPAEGTQALPGPALPTAGGCWPCRCVLGIIWSDPLMEEGSCDANPQPSARLAPKPSEQVCPFTLQQTQGPGFSALATWARPHSQAGSRLSTYPALSSAGRAESVGSKVQDILPFTMKSLNIRGFEEGRTLSREKANVNPARINLKWRGSQPHPHGQVEPAWADTDLPCAGMGKSCCTCVSPLLTPALGGRGDPGTVTPPPPTGL